MAAQLFSTVVIPGVTSTVGQTGSKAPPNARSDASGLNAVWGVYTVTATQTLSTSDVINFFQLPEGAVVLDGYVAGVVKAGTGLVIKVGIGAAGNPSVTGASTDGDFVAALTLSTTRVVSRFGGAATVSALPYQPAAIAAATYPKTYPVNITMVSGTNTSSVSITLYMLYATAGQ